MKTATRALIAVGLLLPLGGLILGLALSKPPQREPQKSAPLPGEEGLWRVRAEYTYKGAPLVLEFGLACRSIWGNAKIHRTSMDVFGGPRAYGVKTPDGNAVVITTQNYCDGIDYKKHNGGMPPRFLPKTVVYDNPDTLEFGILYASDEAYENPLSVLGLPSVSFEAITRETYERIVRDGVPNVVRTPHNLRQGPLFLGRRPPIATYCFGWKRMPLPEAVRTDVRAHWPSDRPHYWSIAEAQYGQANREVSREIEEKVTKAVDAALVDLTQYGPRKLATAAFGGDRTAGLPRRGGGGTSDINWRAETLASIWYPQRWVTKNTWNPYSKIWDPPLVQLNIETASDRARGFLYCYDLMGGTIDFAAIRAPMELSVDGVPVANPPPKLLWQNSEWFFERDTAFFNHAMINLELVGEQIDAN